MPLCGRLFLKAKALFLFGLRAELRINSCCRGLTGKTANRAQGVEQQLRQQQRYNGCGAGQIAKFITTSSLDQGRGYRSQRPLGRGRPVARQSTAPAAAATCSSSERSPYWDSHYRCSDHCRFCGNSSDKWAFASLSEFSCAESANRIYF